MAGPAESKTTIPVKFKDKPKMGVVNINEVDFDPKVHTRMKAAELMEETSDDGEEADEYMDRLKELEKMSAVDVREIAEKMDDFEYTNKAEAIEAILEEEFDEEE